MMRARAAVLLAALALCVPGAARAAESPGSKDPFRYDNKGHRDPFVPLVRDGRLVASQGGQQVETSKPVLYGILWDPAGNSIALINDTEARVGDKIGEFKVKEIQRNAVVLDGGGEPVVLTIAFETGPAPKSPGTLTGGQHP